MNWLILDEALELGRQADQEHKLAKERGEIAGLLSEREEEATRRQTRAS